MKIAVTYENGEVFQHFGRTAQFGMYETADGKILSSQVLNVPEGISHGALAGFLKQQGVEALICGGLGLGAQEMLEQAGVKVYGGASGRAEDAVQAFLNGTLQYDPQAAEHHGPCHHDEHSMN